VRLSKNRPLTIGRSKTNDLILPVGMVSREHSKVFWNGETFEIRDLGSSNGTFVNEEKAERTALKDGDQIKIGPYQLKFQAFSGALDNVRSAEQDLEMTQNITRRDVFEASSTFSGNIAEMGMEEVFQLIDFNKKTGTLEIKVGDRKGEFHFHEGQILAGEFRNSKGEAAIVRVINLQSGSFQFNAGKPEVERTIFTPTGRAVLDAMRRLDEMDR